MKKPSNRFYWFSLLAGLLFLLVYSITTSPLTYLTWGTDSAFFQYVGRSYRKGLLMYRDIFDLKGPYFFLLQQIAYMISSYGRYVLFGIQFLCIAVSLRLFQAIWKQLNLVSMKWQILSVGMYLFLFSFTIDGGNLTEEYALPLLFACLYLFFRYAVTNQHPGWYAFFYGVCFSLMAFTRVTNAYLICVIVLAVLIQLIYERRWKEILTNAVSITLGAVIGAIPILVYCLANGTLTEMINQSFIFAMNYAVNGSRPMRWTMILPMMLLGFGVLAGRSRSVFKIFTVLSLLSTCMVLRLGYQYIHYYQLLIPIFLALFWIFVQDFQPSPKAFRRHIPTLFAALLAAANIGLFVLHSGQVAVAVQQTYGLFSGTSLEALFERVHSLDTSAYFYSPEEERQAMEILEQIPEGKTISSNCAGWLMFTDTVSQSRYCVTPSNFSTLSEDVYLELSGSIERGETDYYVSNRRFEPEDGIFERMMLSHFDLIFENDSFWLYRLNH